MCVNLKRAIGIALLAGLLAAVGAFGVCIWISTDRPATDTSLTWAFRPWYRLNNWLISALAFCTVTLIVSARTVFRPRMPRLRDRSFRVLSTSDGFQVQRADDENIRSVRWQDIREIAAYKVDLFGYDMICVTFRISDRDEWIEVSEEQEGFKNLVAKMQEVMPQIDRDWWSKVAFPAFKQNYTVLYRIA